MAVVIGGKKGPEVAEARVEDKPMAEGRKQDAGELAEAVRQTREVAGGTGARSGPKRYGLVIEGLSGRLEIEAEHISDVPGADGGRLITFLRSGTTDGAVAQFIIGAGKSYGLIYE